jgi:hypothetical protein
MFLTGMKSVVVLFECKPFSENSNMEATRPRLSRQMSQQTTMSQTSTLVPTTKPMGLVPSLAALRQFAANLGRTVPALQNEKLDAVEVQHTFAAPHMQVPVAAHLAGLAEPFEADLEKNVGDKTDAVVGTAVRQMPLKTKIILGVTLGLVAGGVATGLTFLGLKEAALNTAYKAYQQEWATYQQDWEAYCQPLNIC